MKQDMDKEPDILPATDQGESVGLMEPMIVSESSKHREELSDLALELASKSAGCPGSLPDGVLGALANLVRE